MINKINNNNTKTSFNRMNKATPSNPMKKSIYAINNNGQITLVIDIDGTILQYDKYEKNKWGDPIEGAIETINELHDKYNCYIILFTAREDDEKEALRKYLAQHKLHYDELIMNKPKADFYIDDKAIQFKQAQSPYEYGTILFLPNNVELIYKITEQGSLSWDNKKNKWYEPLYKIAYYNLSVLDRNNINMRITDSYKGIIASFSIERLNGEKVTLPLDAIFVKDNETTDEIIDRAFNQLIKKMKLPSSELTKVANKEEDIYFDVKRHKIYKIYKYTSYSDAFYYVWLRDNKEWGYTNYTDKDNLAILKKDNISIKNIIQEKDYIKATFNIKKINGEQDSLPVSTILQKDQNTNDLINEAWEELVLYLKSVENFNMDSIWEDNNE